MSQQEYNAVATATDDTSELNELIARVGVELSEYERMAESLITQVTFAQNRSTPVGDGREVTVPAPEGALLEGIRSHMESVFWSLNWYHPATIRRFYVEMRKWADSHAKEKRVQGVHPPYDLPF